MQRVTDQGVGPLQFVESDELTDKAVAALDDRLVRYMRLHKFEKGQGKHVADLSRPGTMDKAMARARRRARRLRRSRRKRTRASRKRNR